MADLQGQACTYQSERYEVVNCITGVCVYGGVRLVRLSYVVLDCVSHSGIGKVASRGAATNFTSN